MKDPRQVNQQHVKKKKKRWCYTKTPGIKSDDPSWLLTFLIFCEPPASRPPSTWLYSSLYYLLPSSLFSLPAVALQLVIDEAPMDKRLEVNGSWRIICVSLWLNDNLSWYIPQRLFSPYNFVVFYIFDAIWIRINDKHFCIFLC